MTKKKVLTTREVGRLLRFTTATIARWCKLGYIINSGKSSGRWVITHQNYRDTITKGVVHGNQ